MSAVCRGLFGVVGRVGRGDHRTPLVGPVTTPVLMRLTDAATALCVSRWTVARMVATGELPVVTLSKGVRRVRVADVAALAGLVGDSGPSPLTAVTHLTNQPQPTTGEN